METNLDANYSYSVKELAFIWNLDAETVRRIFIEEPGVMMFRRQRPGKRIYRLLRIPAIAADLPGAVPLSYEVLRGFPRGEVQSLADFLTSKRAFNMDRTVAAAEVSVLLRTAFQMTPEDG